MAEVTLRPMGHDDLPRLASWLCQPHVSEWWRGEPKDIAGVVAKYGPAIDGTDPVELSVIVASGRLVGMIQRYLFANEPEWTAVLSEHVDVAGAAGLDYLIGEPDALRHLLTDIARWCAEGKLSVHIHAVYPLTEIAAALRAIADRKVMGKIVLRL